MKIRFPIAIFLFLLGAFSCKDDNPENNASIYTSFNIGTEHFIATKTTAYSNSFGEMLKVVGANFELYIALSDTNSKMFTITDTLKATDIGKARCIIKINNGYKFSTSGTIDLEPGRKSGSFSVITEDVSLSKGQIKVDSTIYGPIADFTRVSGTDYNGWPMTTPDPNDWNIRENWSMEERFVFNLKSTATLSSTAVLAAYPNPCNQYIALSIDFPAESSTDFVVVNGNFEVELVFHYSQSTVCMFDMGNISKVGEYYRMYYRINSASEQFYGAGDVKTLK